MAPFNVKVLLASVSLTKAPVLEMMPESVWSADEEYLNVPEFEIVPV